MGWVSKLEDDQRERTSLSEVGTRFAEDRNRLLQQVEALELEFETANAQVSDLDTLLSYLGGRGNHKGDHVESQLCLFEFRRFAVREDGIRLAVIRVVGISSELKVNISPLCNQIPKKSRSEMFSGTLLSDLLPRLQQQVIEACGRKKTKQIMILLGLPSSFRQQMMQLCQREAKERLQRNVRKVRVSTVNMLTSNRGIPVAR